MQLWVYWSSLDQDAVDGRSFLSSEEEKIFSGFRFEPRRESYLSGRLVAKRLISRALKTDLPERSISILNGPGGAPYAVIDGQRVPGVLSISHAGGQAAAAFTTVNIRLGLDLEQVRPRASAFVKDYFTEQEQALLGRHSADHDRDITLIWSAKEALLKALGIGLRMDTRRVWVASLESARRPPGDGWKSFDLASEDKKWFGFWRMSADSVIVCAVDPIEGYEIGLVEL